VRVGPVSMDSASGAYIIKEVTGDSQEYKINPTCEATFVVPEATQGGPPPDEAFLDQLKIGRFEAVEQRDLLS